MQEGSVPLPLEAVTQEAAIRRGLLFLRFELSLDCRDALPTVRQGEGGQVRRWHFGYLQTPGSHPLRHKTPRRWLEPGRIEAFSFLLFA